MGDQKTPSKESSRSPALNPKSSSGDTPSNKPLQLLKRTSTVQGTSKKSMINLSSVSEISDNNYDDETAEIVVQSSVGSVSPDLSFSSEITGDDASFLLETCDSSKPGNSKIGFLEAKFSANLLTAAKAEVLKSLDANRQTVKLLEREMNRVGGLRNPPGKKTYSGKLASLNIQVFSLVLLLWILTMSVFFFFSAESQSMPFGPLPT